MKTWRIRNINTDLQSCVTLHLSFYKSLWLSYINRYRKKKYFSVLLNDSERSMLCLAVQKYLLHSILVNKRINLYWLKGVAHSNHYWLVIYCSFHGSQIIPTEAEHLELLKNLTNNLNLSSLYMQRLLDKWQNRTANKQYCICHMSVWKNKLSHI